MSNTAFAKADAEVGDKVRVSVDGVVKASDYSKDLYLDVPNYGSWYITADHKVEVLKKAGPTEPTAKNAVVQTDSSDRWVKRSDGKWHHLHTLGTSWGSDLGSRYTWEYLVNNYGVPVELGPTPQLPRDHKVRDLTTQQQYKRAGFGTLDVNKEGGPYFRFALNTGVAGSVREAEAIALAWDILKVAGKVQ
jgi:hypothetical protein